LAVLFRSGFRLADLRIRSSFILEIKEPAVVTPDDYKTLGDPEIIGLCLNGDSKAWEALIRRYRRLIYSIPVKFGFQTADAADVFQSVCVKMLEHLGTLKDESKVSAWLITTTRRQCIQLRAYKQRESSTDDSFEEPLDPAENLEEVQIEVQQQQTIRDAVRQLPDRCRKLIEMLYFDSNERSYEEIAETMEMPIPSIGPTRARCLEKLKAKLRTRGIK
jgi:RNA polymerase sigma factor (sigma-70 family)